MQIESVIITDTHMYRGRTNFTTECKSCQKEINEQHTIILIVLKYNIVLKIKNALIYSNITRNCSKIWFKFQVGHFDDIC